MKPKFVKFPRTHWLPIGEKPYKSERYLTKKEVRELFSSEVNVSEKLDGANVGLSFQQNKLILQKRGGFIGEGEHPQYGAFKEWAYSRYHKFSHLLGGIVLFGEWLYAKHSIHYTRLPDYFVIFDIWRDGEFLPPGERDSIAKRFGLCTVPEIYRGILSLEHITSLVQRSHYCDGLMEGVVVRSLGNPDLRGKYVRPDFITGQKHWSMRKITKNLLTPGDIDINELHKN
ncbi:MAG: hypothetical protein A7316_00620 [Candidatus Altiarchaeales archaeon WOR_SM1_86-2]|nr:MAG: hypothetical protein A7316_00620 [Candidatus Altiarchaeales archaeon WOR_SM1_86-2]